MSFFSGPLSSQDIFHLEQPESRIASKSQARHTIDGSEIRRSPPGMYETLWIMGKTTNLNWWMLDFWTINSISEETKIKVTTFRHRLSGWSWQRTGPNRGTKNTNRSFLPADRCQQEERSKTRPTAMTTSLLGLKRHSSTIFVCWIL